jgi:hypothetical protein
VGRDSRLQATIERGRSVAEAATVEVTAAQIGAALDPDADVRRAA